MPYDFCDLPPAEIRIFQPNVEHPEPPADPPHILAAYFDTRDGSLNFATTNLTGWIKYRPRLPLFLTHKHVISEAEVDWSPRLRIGTAGTIKLAGRLRIG